MLPGGLQCASFLLGSVSCAHHSLSSSMRARGDNELDVVAFVALFWDSRFKNGTKNQRTMLTWPEPSCHVECARAPFSSECRVMPTVSREVTSSKQIQWISTMGKLPDNFCSRRSMRHIAVSHLRGQQRSKE